MDITITEAIEQLADLRSHCEDMKRGYLEGEECPWEKDAAALDMAIQVLTDLDEFGEPHDWKVMRGLKMMEDFGKAMIKSLAEEEAALRAKGIDPWAELDAIIKANPDMSFEELMNYLDENQKGAVSEC